MLKLSLFIPALFSISALADSCRLGADLSVGGKVRHKCQVTGHTEIQQAKTYLGVCDGEEDQLEMEEGSATAKLIDVTSRAELAKCDVDRAAVGHMIEEYKSKNLNLENPNCYLTQWKGQMMFVAGPEKGRCSFRMNKNKSQEFKTKTGVTPLYQCERDFFLSAGDKTAARVYKRSKDGWELACRATMRVGDPVDDIDWKNPPAYYEPEADASGHKSDSPKISRLDLAPVFSPGP